MPLGLCAYCRAYAPLPDWDDTGLCFRCISDGRNPDGSLSQTMSVRPGFDEEHDRDTPLGVDGHWLGETAASLRGHVLGLFDTAQAFDYRRRRVMARLVRRWFNRQFDKEARRIARDSIYRRRFCEWCACRIAGERSLHRFCTVPRYCSAKCVRAAKWWRKATTPTGSLACQHCGIVFEARGWLDKRKYHSKECMRLAKLERKRAAWVSRTVRAGRTARDPAAAWRSLRGSSEDDTIERGCPPPSDRSRSAE